MDVISRIASRYLRGKARWVREGVPPEKVRALDRLVRLIQANTGDHYISFADVNKVGIYPLSNYETPLGIYMYPLSILDGLVPVIEAFGEDPAEVRGAFKVELDAVPFAGKRQYILVLQRNSRKMLHLGKYTWPQAHKDAKKLLAFVASKYPGVNFTNSLQSAKDNLQESILEGFYKSKVERPGAFIWNLMYGILDRARISDRTKAWASMLRALGYDFVEDPGLRIISSNEPKQAVALTAQAVETVFVMLNPLRHQNKGRGEEGGTIKTRDLHERSLLDPSYK